MTSFLLVRHGQTDWNAARRYQGQSDIPLNQTGIDQAKSLAKKLTAEKFDAIYSSDLSRAYQTAVILADTLQLQVQQDRRLREICQGIWEGMSLDEVQEKYAEDFRRGAEDPAYSRAPGGESVAEVAARMSAAADEISRIYPGGRILIASHGLAVSALYCLAKNIPLNQVYDFIPENTVPLSVEWHLNHSSI